MNRSPSLAGVGQNPEEISRATRLAFGYKSAWQLALTIIKGLYLCHFPIACSGELIPSSQRLSD
jgi:hypothetical protein